MTNHEIVKKLIGNINPVGDTNTDTERLENLKEMCELAHNILLDIDDMIYRNKDMHQSSIKKCVNEAQSLMRTIKELTAS